METKKEVILFPLNSNRGVKQKRSNKKLLFITLIFFFSLILVPSLVSATITVNPDYETFTYIGRGTNGGTTLTNIPADSTNFDYFPDDAVVNDAIYFGWNNGRWDSLKLYVGTAFAADNVTFVWEYWNGAWTPLSVTDNTNGFTNLGEHTVEFTPPTDWKGKNLIFSGSYKYQTLWIRCRIDAVTNITEGGAQSTQPAKHKRYEIEVTGDYSAYTNIFKQIYDADQANGWGLTELTEKGIQINCNVGFGDGSTTTIVKTQRESVSVKYDNIWIKPQCTFTAGVLSATGYTYYGSRIEMCTKGADMNMVSDGATAKFYNTQIIQSGEYGITKRVHFRGNTDFQDVIFEGFNRFCPDRTTVNVKRFKMKGGRWFGTAVGNVEDVILQSNGNDMFTLVYSITARDLKVESSASKPYRNYRAHGTMIDCDVSDDLSDWSFWGGSDYWVKFQQSFNLKVIDKDNNPIDGSIVTLKDKNGTQVFSVTTNASGVIPEQLVTRTYFEMDSINTATKTDYNPFTLTISHQDYPSKEFNFTLDKKTDWTIALGDRPQSSGIINVYGTEYAPGEEGVIYAQVLYGDGTPANNATCNVTIFNKNTTWISEQNLTYISGSDGSYYYNFTVPSNISVFMTNVRCSNPTAYGSGDFHVSTWARDITQGLKLYAHTGSFYSPSDKIDIYATTTDNQGALINTTVDVEIFYPNGTSLNSGQASYYETGRANYTFTLPSNAPTGTYRAEIDSNYSYYYAHETLTFLISPILEDISDVVDYINTTITNTIIPYLQEINSTTHTTYTYLTDTIKPQLDGIGENVSYIRDNMATSSALSSLQSDVTWLIDNVATQENITMLEGKIDTIDSNIDTLITRTDCSVPANSVLCTYLKNTNSTVTDIKNNWGSYTADDIITRLNEVNTTTQNTYSYLQNEITTRLTELNTTTQNIYTDTQSLLSKWGTYTAQQLYNISNATYYKTIGIYNDMATSVSITTLQTDIDWLKDNTATQQNITELLNRLTGIDNNLTDIRTTLDCSDPTNSDLCGYLDNINTTVNSINSSMALQSTLLEVQNNITWLVDNVATQTNITAIISKIDVIDTDVDELITRTDCSNSSRNNLTSSTYALCSYLFTINDTVNYIKSNMALQSILQDVQTTVNTINSTCNDIKQMLNCTMQSAVCDKLDDLSTNLTDLTNTVEQNNSAIWNKLVSMEGTINTIAGDVDNVEEMLDCSVSSEVCTKLNNIGSFVAEINATTWKTFNNITLTVVPKLNTIDANTDEIEGYVDSLEDELNCINPQASDICYRLNLIQGYTDSLETNINDTKNLIIEHNSTVNAKLDSIAGTISTINTNTDEIEGMLNCTVSNAHCDKLDSITTITTDSNSTIYSLKSYLEAKYGSYDWSWLNTFLTNINSTVDNTNYYLKNDIVNRFDSVDGNLTEIDTYLSDTIYTKLNETYNNTHQTLTYIGNPVDDEDQNTLFGEHAYTQNRLAEINSNLTYLKTLTEHINITTEAINSTVSTILLEVDDLEELHQCSINPNSTICTLLNNIYADTQSIYDLSLAINQTTSSMNLFEISALIAGSPRYANEEVLVEATFSGQNGSYVEPDTINITIYDPNDNIWQSATKAQFTEGSDHIWKYTKSISSNPTTGMYTIHMQASYQGVSASKSAQFRIATGGPYKVYLECPDTSYVGQNLVCSVILLDEGEVPAESTSTVWVDTNNNLAWDAGEPVTSFSKQTVPLQSVTQSVSINVPSSHSTGLHVVRVTTSYANSAQPDSTASDSVTFSTAPPEEAPTGGVLKSEVEVPEEIIEIEEKEGKIQVINFPEKIDIIKTESLEKTIGIKNIGEGNLNNVRLVISGLPLDSYTIFPEKYDVVLPEETKTFTITFKADIEAKEYEIKFLVTSDEGSKEVDSVLVVKGVEEIISEKGEEKIPIAIIVPSYWSIILIILVVLGILTYLGVNKKEEIKELFKRKHKAKEKITTYNLLNTKNIIIVVLAVIVLVSLLFNISIKEISSKIINVLSAIKLPSISLNLWFVLGGLVVLFLAGIFVVLVLILKELKRIAPKKKPKKKHKKRTKK